MEIKSLIAIISLLLSVIGTVITRYLSVKEKKYLESNSLTDEIENLDNISENLKNLQKFISIQKNNLIDNEKTIIELEEKKKELKPLIESQEKTVEAILKAHSERQKKSKWLDYLIGFFIGIASSAIVALIFHFI